MVRIGIVGIGFMGRIHFLASQNLRGARVTAICSRDPKKLSGDWSGTRGNFGPEPGRVDLAGITPYDSLDAMLSIEKRECESPVESKINKRPGLILLEKDTKHDSLCIPKTGVSGNL